MSTWDGSFNFSFKKLSSILTLIGSILAIMVLVYGSARAGVASAVKEEINAQIVVEQSPLNRQIHAVIEEHEKDICEPRWREVQYRLGDLDVGAARMETKIDILLERAAE